jgi:hypothetical protein
MGDVAVVGIVSAHRLCCRGVVCARGPGIAPLAESPLVNHAAHEIIISRLFYMAKNIFY